MKKNAKRLLSSLLCAVMFISTLPLTALAAEESDNGFDEEIVSFENETDVIEETVSGEEIDVTPPTDTNQEETTQVRAESTDTVEVEEKDTRVFPESAFTDGKWLYDVVDGYARVLGYTDTTVTALDIPDQLGGYYVNAIGEKAFAANTALRSLYIHGNVISIADNAFDGVNVELEGYNGTTVLLYAAAEGISSDNLSDQSAFKFTDKLIDFSYALNNRCEILSDTSIKMNAAEAAQLGIGDVFFLPFSNDNLLSAYEVISLDGQGDYVIITVKDANAEDVLVRISVEETELIPDWSNAEWIDGVEIYEEKLSFSTTSTGSINLKYTKDLGKQKVKKTDGTGTVSVGESPASFSVEGNISFKGTASLDYDFWAGTLNTCSLIVEPSVTIKGALSLSGDNTKENTNVKVEMVKPTEYEYYLGSVPLISAAKVVEVKVAVYVKVSATGEITVTLKGAGKMGTQWNSTKKAWEGINTWGWEKPSISGSVNVTIGPAQAVELHCFALGKVLSLEMFEGGVIDFTAKTIIGNWDVCFDLKVKGEVSLTLALKLELFKNDTSKLENKWSWELFSVSKEIFNAHYEIGGGLLNKCTYEDSFTVDFNTFTAESVDSQTIKGGAKVQEPQLTKTAGTLEGWYTDKNFKSKWDFDKDTIKSDMTLYANWISNAHTVHYVCNWTEPDFDETAGAGKLLTAPESLKWTDHVFDGWYKDAALTKPWNFSTDVMPDSDLTLYGAWHVQVGYDPYAVSSTSNGDVSFNGHTYTHIMTYMSFSEARAYAEAAGGYLATINSAEEQKFLADYLYRDCAQDYLWLGMNSTGNWQYWLTGEKVSYTNWESSPTTSSTQYNGALRRTSGKWTTLDNGQTAHFVIEWGNYVADPAANITTIKSDVQYVVDNNTGTASVTGWNKDVEDITILKTYEGYPVTSIAAKAFQNNAVLKTISIPNTVITIGDYAFAGCTKLQSVTIPDSVSSMGIYVFNGCTGLETVEWSKKLKTIPEFTFYQDSNLTGITDIAAVTTIGNFAFSDCSSLVNFTYPSSLTFIGNYAFNRCSSLTNGSIPDSVYSIGSNAFYFCSRLTSITVPSSLSAIHSDTFYYCTGASTVLIPANVSYIDSYAFYGTSATFKYYTGSYAESWLKDKGYTMSSMGANYKITYSTNNSISTNVPGTKDGNMVGDAYVAVGKRVTEPMLEVEGYVIEGWYTDPEFTKRWDFTSDTMPESNLTLYAKWVEAAAAFEFDVIDGLAKITGYNGSNDIVIIPETLNGYKVNTIADGAFTENCIASIQIPATVTTIENGAFDAKNLYAISVNPNSKSFVVVDGILYSKAMKRLICAPQGRVYTRYTVPNGVTTICKKAFANQDDLISIVIPDSVTSIASDTFMGNHFLVIYGSVGDCSAKTYAQKYNFDYNLYTVTFYDGNTIMYYANIVAGELIENYYEPVTDFLSYGGWFKNSSLMNEWDFTKDKMPAENMNLYLKWDSDFSITANGSEITITGYNGTLSDIVIPEKINGYTVTGIASGAFTKTKYKSVEIPSSVTAIASGAFRTSLTIIGDADSAAQTHADEKGIAFSLKKYTVTFDVQGGSRVESIQVTPGETFSLPVPIRSNYYFAGWYEDTGYSIAWTSADVMPASDVTLYALWRIANSNITDNFSYNILDDGTVEITNYNGTKTVLAIPSRINGYTVSRIGSFAFNGNNTLLTVTIPDTVMSIGEYAFANTSIRTVKGCGSLETIEACAFANVTGLRTMTLPETLVDIGNEAFFSCMSMTEMAFPASVKSIGSKAFYGCSNLDEAVFTDSIKRIGTAAFADCPKLDTVTLPSTLRGSAENAFGANTAITYTGTDTLAILSVKQKTTTSVTLLWNEVIGASGYNLLRKEDGATKFTTVKAVTSYSTTTSSLTTGKTYIFKIQAYDVNGNVIIESDEVSVFMTSFDVPVIQSVTQKSSSTATMTLKKITGATGYEVCRAYEIDGEYTLLKSSTASSFTNSGLVPGGDYYYMVRAYAEDSTGNRDYSEWSEIFYFHMPYKFMTVPENVIVRQSGANGVEVSWDAVDGAEGYTLYRSVDGGTFNKVKDITTASTFNNSLTNGSTYAYKISAFFTDHSERIVGVQSDAASVKILDIATPAITSVIQSKNGTVTIEWSAVKGAGGYALYRSTEINGTYSKVKSVTTTSAENYNLTVGQTYYYKVRAYVTNTDETSVYGDYSPCASITVNVLPAVSGVTAEQISGSEAKISWTSVSGANGYEIWYSANNQNNYVLVSDITGKNATVTGLNDGVNYYFVVRSYKNNGIEKEYGSYSDTVSVQILGTPKLRLAEQTSATAAELIWDTVSSAEGYEVWRKTGNGTYSKIKTVTVNLASNYSLSANTLYTYKVRAYTADSNGNKVYGYYSDEIAVRMLATPEITEIKQASATSVTIKWSKVSGAEGYALYRSTTKNGVYELVKTVSDTNTVNYSLTAECKYYYKVAAYSTISSVKGYSKESDARFITLLSAPIITSIEQTTSTGVTIAWEKVNGATGYRLYRYDFASGDYKLVKTVTTTSTETYSLTAGNTYSYKVTAYKNEDDADHIGVMSSASSIYISALKKPVISSLMQSSSTNVEIFWNKISGADGYQIVRATSLNGSYENIKTVTATSTFNYNLSTGTTYYYKIRAYTVENGRKRYGMYSDPVGVKILAVPIITSVVQTGNTSATISWKAVSNATGYRLYRSDSLNGTYELVKSVTDTTTVNYSLTTGNSYYYKVVAYASGSSISSNSAYSDAVKVTISSLKTPAISEAVQTNSGTVSLKWANVSGAEGYELSRSTEETGTYSVIKNVAATNTSTYSLIDGRIYWFRIRAYVIVDGEKQYSPYSKPVSVTLVEAPVLNYLFQTNSTTAKLVWSVNNEVTGYEIWKKTDSSSYSKVKSVTETEAETYSLTAGTNYTFKVRAYTTVNGAMSYSGYSNEMSIMPITFTDGTLPECEHNYTDNMNKTWTYTLDGAEALLLKFSPETRFENNYDRLYIMDADGNTVGDDYYSGTSLAGAYFKVEGDTVQLKMTTDGSVTYYGFSLEFIKPASN